MFFRDFGGNGKSTLTTPTDACQIMCSNAHLPHTAPPALRYPAPIFLFFGRKCRGLSNAGQATMLDVTEILFKKWGSFLAQTVIRCWLKAAILPSEHEDALRSKDTRPDREDKEDKATIDDICSMVAKMTMPASVADARSMPRVLTDNLFVKKQPGLTGVQMHEAMGMWLNVEDGPPKCWKIRSN